MKASAISPNPASEERTLDPEVVERHFRESLRGLHIRTDHFFARLLLVEWLACVAVGIFFSERNWEGLQGHCPPHVWLALGLGAVVVGYPAWLGLNRGGEPLTRHLLAVAQMLTSSLLIHLTGGRIETHFHIFGSLAFLAFYRDSRVLLTATLVAFLDHVVRGIFWPESVYGVVIASPWRSVEHGLWILFEVVFLWGSIRRSRYDMRQAARRQMSLEVAHGEMERKVEERTEELMVSEQRFRTLFKESPIGLYRAAPDGRIYLANPALLQMLGHTSAEEVWAAAMQIQGVESETGRREMFRDLERAGSVYSRDLSWRCRDGSLLFVRESVKAIHDGEGKVLYFDGSVEDVTERRKLEENYLQAQKVQAIGQLAGGVAHDFNNVLTTIIGYSDLLLESLGPDEDARGHVAEIKKAGERASSLTRQLLAFSRKQTLQPRTLFLNDIVQEMDKMLRRLVGEDIEIRTRLAPDLFAARADSGQIQQVLMNLVVNARDAMPGGGKLTLETRNELLDEAYCRLHPDAVVGSYVMITVSDNGLGMTREVKARLFEPFFTTKEPGKGTGLGLATCHGIVRQSGGHISVYSEPGLGTTFRVYIPVDVDGVSAAEEKPLSGIRRGTETIVFVEDELSVRELGVMTLSSLGYRVIEAENGVDALEKVKKEGVPVDLFVIDVVMPKMGGRELARKVRELDPQARVLFTSGYTQEAIDREAPVEAGAFFLSKPYSLSMLAEKVREVIECSPALNGVAASSSV